MLVKGMWPNISLTVTICLINKIITGSVEQHNSNDWKRSNTVYGFYSAGKIKQNTKNTDAKVSALL